MDNETRKTLRTLGYLSVVGMAMAISITIGALIGYFLDKKFHTEPWLFLIFLALGIVAAFKNLLFMVRKIQDHQ